MLLSMGTQTITPFLLHATAHRCACDVAAMKDWKLLSLLWKVREEYIRQSFYKKIVFVGERGRRLIAKVLDIIEERVVNAPTTSTDIIIKLH